MSDNSPTVGSICSGIGGFDLGFMRAGFRIVWQVEIDPYCLAVLARHWPRARQIWNLFTCEPSKVSTSSSPGSHVNPSAIREIGFYHSIARQAIARLEEFEARLEQKGGRA